MTPGAGPRIRLRRQQLGLTQAELARRIGVHVSTVTSWETGKHFPDRHQGAVEAELGMSLNGVPEPETYTDPLEEAIWAETTLPPDARREIIARVRQARSGPRRAERPPA